MRPESVGHRRAPLIESSRSRIPAVHEPSSPAAMQQQPRGLQLPTHTEQLQSSMCTEGREGTGGLAHE